MTAIETMYSVETLARRLIEDSDFLLLRIATVTQCPGLPDIVQSRALDATQQATTLRDTLASLHANAFAARGRALAALPDDATP